MDETVKVEHPAWCDAKYCTAPELRPTRVNYTNEGGEHRSAPVLIGTYAEGMELRIYLSQSEAPWSTSTYVRVQTANDQMSWMTRVDDEAGGFPLFDMLAKSVGGLAAQWPTLYSDRYGWVAEGTMEPPGEYCVCADPNCPTPDGQYACH